MSEETYNVYRVYYRGSLFARFFTHGHAQRWINTQTLGGADPQDFEVMVQECLSYE